MNTPANVVVDQSATTTDAAPATALKKPGHVTDAKGRRIIVKPLDPLELYRLARVMGPAADSEFTRSLASLAACVRAINDEPQPFPNTDREIQAMLQLLGSEGIDAVNDGLSAVLEQRNANEAAKIAAGEGAIKN